MYAANENQVTGVLKLFGYALSVHSTKMFSGLCVHLKISCKYRLMYSNPQFMHLSHVDKHISEFERKVTIFLILIPLTGQLCQKLFFLNVFVFFFISNVYGNVESF